MTKCLQNWLAPFAVEAVKVDVKDVRIDSREVNPGDVFVAVQGVNQHGLKFIDTAIAAGAVAVLVDEQAQVTAKSVPVYAVTELAKVLPELLAAFYDIDKMHKVGITGTNGKTTISQLIAQLGKQLQQNVAVVGTLGAGPLDKLVEMNNTTPGIANNFRLLAEFAAAGFDKVAMEVSSQGLAQGRVAGIGFATAIFSNLTQDHLDYHGDMASYANAKKMLFEQNPDALTIVNVNDEIGLSWYRAWQGERSIVAVGAFDDRFTEQPHVMFDEVEYTTKGLRFTVKSHWGEALIVCPLYGRFNLHNLVSAMAVYLAEGVPLEHLVSACAGLIPVPGRMERFGNEQLVAIVDYAHTPDALAQALQAVKAHVKGRLWCIFGCGGNRDAGKRPLMGQMAAQYADQIVVTNDNPRHESGQAIAEQIIQGIHHQNVVIELDRKAAITNTLNSAAKGDIVLIAGKGHERYQIFGDEVIEYDERSFVRQYFAENNEEMAS